MDRYAEIRELVASLSEKVRMLPKKRYESRAEEILRIVIGSELTDAERDMDILIGGNDGNDSNSNFGG